MDIFLINFGTKREARHCVLIWLYHDSLQAICMASCMTAHKIRARSRRQVNFGWQLVVETKFFSIDYHRSSLQKLICGYKNIHQCKV